METELQKRTSLSCQFEQKFTKTPCTCQYLILLQFVMPKWKTKLEETQTADSAIGLCAAGSPCDNFQRKTASRVMRRLAERNDHAVREAENRWASE